MKAQAPINMPTLSGWRYRATHKASITAILGADTRQVRSEGTNFANMDRWTLRLFIAKYCQWCKEHDGAAITSKEVAEIVYAVNSSKYPRPEILIANTPDELPQRIAMALVGGAYHEAWHTKYDRTANLNTAEMAAIVVPRHAKVSNWGKYVGMLLMWSNVVADIRIERLGRRDYPGTEVKMHDLQDFIIGTEEKDRQTAMEAAQQAGHAHPEQVGIPKTLSIIMCLYRDIGLGYNTNAQQLVLEKYKQWNPKACEMVLNGPLSPILRENISLASSDDLSPLRLALDIVAELADLAEDEASKGQQGTLKQCPKCGAPAGKIKLRPAPNQGSLKGASSVRGILVCTVCGWTQEVDLKKEQDKAKGDKQDGSGGLKINMPGAKKGKGQSDPDDDSEAIDAEGFDDWMDDDDEEGEKDSKGTKSDDDGDEGDEEGDGKGGKDKDAGSGKGKDPDGKDPAKDSKGTGKDGDKDGDDGDKDEGPGKKPQRGMNGKGKGQDGKSKDAQGKGAGGTGSDDPVADPQDFKDLAKEAAGQQAEIKDVGSALNQEFQAFDEKKSGQNVKRDEAPYRPMTYDNDTITPVQPSKEGQAKDAMRADLLFQSVKAEASFLRARFRNMFRALEIRDTTHGVRTGKAISDRMLVDSKACLLSGQIPNRAYYDVSETIDTSVAACLVIDESGSMHGENSQTATQAMCAITEPLDAVGAAVQVAGFRSGGYWGGYPQAGYHRSGSIHHDVFKTFDEHFKSIRWRFANTRAEGGTPMADGIQFALDALNTRREGHRIVFVITDGQPDPDHYPVMVRQIRLAKESGVHIIGVGIGDGAAYVKQVFPDHVWSRFIPQLPKLLVAKLNEIVDTQVSKRGRKIKSAAR